MNKTLVVFDVDMTLSQGILEQALFVAMDHQLKLNQYHKVYKGQSSWPILFQKVLELYPPHLLQIEEYLRSIPMVDGIKETLRWLKYQQNTSVIILSGGNNLLVNKYLQINQASHYFHDIYASQLSYNPILHKYNYYPIEGKCSLTTCKICKTKAFNFQQIIKAYDRVFYVGDGLNDLCGMSVIQNGMAFVRKGFQLQKKHAKSNILGAISVDVKYWANGYQLSDLFETLF